MVLEVPTGWFADRFGYRRSLILGSLVQVAGMICCWLADGVPGLVTACLLVALGDAFRSGADQALLYRTCVAIGREPEYQRIEARSRAVQVVALAAMVVACGAIVTIWGFAAGWLAETLVCACGCLVACAMVEPPACADDSDEATPPASKSRVPWRTLALVIVPVALLDAAASAGSFLMQTTGDFRPGEITVLVALITLADAAGSVLAIRLPAAVLGAPITLGVAGLAVMSIALTLPAALVPATIALAFATGLSHPLRAAAIQRIATDGVRARAASAASACHIAFSTLFLLLTGSCWGGGSSNAEFRMQNADTISPTPCDVSC
jgi:MFS family permease